MSQVTALEIFSKSGKKFIIRTAEGSDAAGILAHIKEVTEEKLYTLLLPKEFLFTEGQEVVRIQEMKDNPASLQIVAELENEIVGVLDFTSGHRQQISHTGAFGISVSKEYRESGVGNALIECMLEWASAHPVIEKVCLKVHATNSRAIDFYQKHGFFKEGRQIKDLKYAPNEYVDTLLMAKFVKPSE